MIAGNPGADNGRRRRVRQRTRFGFWGRAMALWTLVFVVWFAPRGIEWCCDYRDLLAYRSGAPTLPRRGPCFLTDFWFKLAFAFLVLLSGYGVLALCAGVTGLGVAISRPRRSRRVCRPRLPTGG
ncbi:MAG: hypothetical protein U1E73_01705 [Planctomycetota bacterium]